MTDYSESTAAYYSLGAVALPLTLLSLLLLTLLFGWLYSVYTASRRAYRPHPEDQQQLCGHPGLDPGVLEYRIIFRLGCPSPLFDYAPSGRPSRAWLEFLLIEEDEGAPLFQPVRFRAADLRRDHVCGELVLILYRGWELPPLLGVLGRHSEQGEVIYFYEFSVYGPNPINGAGTAYLGTYPIHAFMGSEEAFYEVKSVGPVLGGVAGKRKGRSTNEENEGGQSVDDMFPLLPEVEWEPVEMVFCAVVAVVFLAAVLMLAEYGNFYPSSSKVEVPMTEQHGSLWRSLLNVLYVLPLILVILVIILSGYKYGIKKRLRDADYGIEGQSKLLWWWADTAYKLMGVTLFVVATVELSFLGGYLTLLGALYWWSGLFIAIVLFFGLWCSAEKYVYLKRCLGAGETAVDREAFLRVRNPNYTVSDNAHPQLLMTTIGTTYFSSLKFNSKNQTLGGYNYLNDSSNQGSSNVAHVTAGPKLVNIKPLLQLGSKQLKLASKVKKNKTAAISTTKSSKESKGSRKRSKVSKRSLKGIGPSCSQTKTKVCKKSSKVSKKSQSSSSNGQKMMKSSPKKFKKRVSIEKTGKSGVPSPQKSLTKKVKGQNLKV